MWISVYYPDDDSVPFSKTFTNKVYFSDEEFIPLAALDSPFLYRFYNDDYFNCDILMDQGFEERFPGVFFRELGVGEFIGVLRSFLSI